MNLEMSHMVNLQLYHTKKEQKVILTSNPYVWI
jgi:hypothetical protein